MPSMPTIQQKLDTLYEGINGYDISFKDRTDAIKENKSFTYGEMLLEPFARILDAINPQAGETFYDLGSGTGKVLIMADQLYDFSMVCGIEFLPSLNAKANEILLRYKRKHRDADIAKSGQIVSKQGDMLAEDLSDADIIFVHATCMMPELINNLGHKLRTCKPRARFVMISRGFFGLPWFACIDRIEYVNAWKSTSTAHIYKLAAAN